MKSAGTIILPKGTTLDVVAKHLVAFANSMQDATMKVNCEMCMTAKERKQVEQELNILLLEFGEAEFLDYISYSWEEDNLIIRLQDWGGPLLFEGEENLYIRRDCKVSALKREKKQDRKFVPIVVQ